ncbi:MAG: tetratricopeptide repeat protein [Bacteroidota bacterium]
MKYKFLITCTLLTTFHAMFAQNTIGGKAKIVPESEVVRQSAFVDAERETLLGNWDKAIGLYKDFTYDNPNNDAGWYGLARAYQAKEDYISALDAIGKAVEKDPNNAWYTVFQANCYEKNGRAKDAAKLYDGLVKRYPSNADYLRQLAYFSLLDNDPKTALKSLERVENLEGVTEETSSKKFMIYQKMGDMKKSAQEMQKLADAYSNKIEYRRQLAQFYEAIGDDNDAQRVYQDILKYFPNDNAAKLALQRKAKRSSSDIEYLNSLKPLFENPQTPIDAKLKEVVPYLGKIKGGVPEISATLLELGAILEKVSPRDPKAYSFSGAVLYQSNRRVEALDKYRQCIKLNPNVFAAWENTLSMLEEQKLFDEMLTVSEQAIDAFPNQPRAYLYYAIAATEKGKYDEAIAQLQQAAIMSGNTPVGLDILDQMAATYLRKKDLDNAKINLDKALSKGGDKHPGVLLHYGDLMFAKGDKTAADAYWQKSYDITRNPAILDKIKGQ